MISNFITVLNGVITGYHSGDLNADFYGTQYYGHERVPVPEGISVNVFDRLEFYGKDWKRKSDCQLIDEGLMTMPEGYVREGDKLRSMTPEERIISGIDKPPKGFKVLGQKIIAMTLLEQVEAGYITQEEYNAQIMQKNVIEFQQRLAEFQTPEALAKAEINEQFSTDRKASIAALLAVKEQKEWPLKVEWPE